MMANIFKAMRNYFMVCFYFAGRYFAYYSGGERLFGV